MGASENAHVAGRLPGLLTAPAGDICAGFGCRHIHLDVLVLLHLVDDPAQDEEGDDDDAEQSELAAQDVEMIPEKASQVQFGCDNTQRLDATEHQSHDNRDQRDVEIGVQLADGRIVSSNICLFNRFKLHTSQTSVGRFSRTRPIFSPYTLN